MLEKTNVKTLENVVVRFSGDSGDGMQLAGNIFKSGNAYLLQKDSASLHAFSCQIEKKRCFQQSVFPFSGRLSGSLRSFIFFWAEKKSVFSAKRKIFLMRVILNRA